MGRKIAGVISAVIALGWWFFSGYIEAAFFENVVRVTDPSMRTLLEYGPPVCLILLAGHFLLNHREGRDERRDPDETMVDNRGGNYVGGNQIGTQTTFHGPVTFHGAMPPANPVPEPDISLKDTVLFVLGVDDVFAAGVNALIDLVQDLGQAAANGTIKVWGCRPVVGPAVDFLVGTHRNKVSIAESHWVNSVIDEIAVMKGESKTRTTVYDDSDAYYDLHFNRSQIEAFKGRWHPRTLEKQLQQSPLRLSVGENGGYFSTKGTTGIYSIRRTFNLKVENTGNAKISACRIHLLSIEPQTEYIGPWIIGEGFDLASGDCRFVPLVSYREARNPKVSDYSDSFMEILPSGPGTPKPAKVGTHLLAVRATGMECPARDFRCNVWVDRDGRLRIEAVG